MDSQDATTRKDTVEDRTRYLRKVSFLQHASDQVLESIATVMQFETAPAGHEIIKKGEHGDTMYFVAGGAVRVHDGDTNLTTLESGDMFGEIAALSPKPRTASITAEVDCALYSINQQLLYEVFDREPGAARSIIQGLCEHESNFAQEVSERTAQIHKLEAEMEIGRRIQKGFLPSAPLEVPGWNIDSYFKAAREVAGDFFDYFEVRSCGAMAVVLGDVCDKGVGAALFMTLFRSLIRSNAQSFDFTSDGGASTVSPTYDQVLGQTVRIVNQYVAGTHANDSMFATLFIALINPKTGELAYINAGHEAACLIARGGEIRRLDSTGPVVGLFAEAKYGVENARMGQGEVLLVFSDGISEAKNELDQEFGDEQVVESLRNKTSAEEAVSSLVAAAADFAGAAKQFDDITVLAVERHSL